MIIIIIIIIPINNIISERIKLAPKENKTRCDWEGEGDPLGIVQVIKIWPYEQQVVYAHPKIRPGEWDA